MKWLFEKHYSREEAEQMLPSITSWLQELDDLNHRLYATNRELQGPIGEGQDLGGSMVNTSIRIESRIQEILQEFSVRDIQIKDLDRWLIDFPAIIGEREVFLCWQKGETCVEFWHDLEAGFGGRTPI